MNGSWRRAALATLLLASTALANAAHAADADAPVASASDIIVTGVTGTQSSAATGLALDLKETPQSLTIVDRQRIDDFRLSDVNDLLEQVVGINVERAETDRSQYNSRGFDITNFQVDGIGLPLVGDVQIGAIDTFLYERVDAVRGANAIMTGIGNPSATVNFVRKRPTDTLRGSATAQIGSWSDKRLELDLSGPILGDDTVTVRGIFAHEDRNSYLDLNKNNREVYGALVAWKIVPDVKLTLGYSRQDNESDGVLWGALPLSYTDGTQIRYARSTSTAAAWTYWNTHDQTAFAELAWTIGNGWSARGVFTYQRIKQMARLLYASGYPDRETGLGVVGSSGLYPSRERRMLGDFYASGPVTVFGRAHQLAFGVSTGRARLHEYEGFSEDLYEYSAVGSWDGRDIPRFTYPEATRQTNLTDRLTRAYVAAHLNISDRLKGVAGASAAWLKTTGSTYGTDAYRKDNKVSPYAGLLYDVSPNVTLYGSYTDIFNPQTQQDIGNRRLAPAKGSSIETGIKSEWFDKKLYATAAVFRARQKGLAEYVGTQDDGRDFYTGVDTTAKGVELEVAGRINERWTVNGGYTRLWIKDQAGDPARTFVARNSFKLATTYALPELRDLKLGAQLRWQSGISMLDPYVQDYGLIVGDAVIRQKGYAMLDLLASVRVIDKVRASVNVDNVTNSKYLNGLQWGQAFYAEPRNVKATVSYDY